MTMKQIIHIAIIFIGIFSPVISLAAQDVSAVIQEALPGVVVVYAQNEAGGYGQGSGFFVTNNGDVATNHHVVEGRTAFAIKTNKGNIYPALVRAYDKERDIAILATNTPPSEYKVLSLTSQIAAIGTSVYAIGAPKGLEKSVSDGLVSQIRKLGDSRYLQVSCPISPGSSGGPILNINGEVVGMTTLFLAEGQNLNFAVPSPTLKTFIEYGKNLDPIAMVPKVIEQTPSPDPPKRPERETPKERYVYLSTQDGFESYLDTYSLQQNGHIVRLWVVHKLNSEAARRFAKTANIRGSYKNITVLAEHEINFYTREMRYLQGTARSESGEILNKETSAGPWERLVPNAPGSKAYDYLLENYYKE
jgi:hypothetical protein